MASNRYDNLIKKFVKEANKRPVTVDGEKVLIPWQLIKAMMQQESAGQPGAKSPIRKGKRAIGLLQGSGRALNTSSGCSSSLMAISTSLFPPITLAPQM